MILLYTGHRVYMDEDISVAARRIGPYSHSLYYVPVVHCVLIIYQLRGVTVRVWSI